MTIKVATAFSGGLAACEFALRYENINHEIIFACENDKYARNQYIKFHGEPKTFYNDVSKLDANKYLNKIDLFVWGSPCQDLSLAGNRTGFNGDKSSLFREGARVMREMMPEIFIFENVKGLLSSNKGNDFKEVVKTFQEIGYLIATKVINTKDYGIPQNRERVFIVGFLDVEKYHKFNFAEREQLKLSLKDILEKDVDEKYYLSKKTIDGFIYKSNKHKSKGNGFKFSVKTIDDIASAISTKSGNRLTDNYIKIKLNQIGNIDKIGHNSLCAKTGLYLVKSGNKKGYEIATNEDCINFKFASSKTRSGRVKKEIAHTIECNLQEGVIQDYKIRKLTPRECFRLQGVHDKDIDLINSDTQNYKIAGNAISVNVMQMILRQIYKPKKIKNSLF